jgi:hypothetical protein
LFLSIGEKKFYLLTAKDPQYKELKTWALITDLTISSITPMLNQNNKQIEQTNRASPSPPLLARNIRVLRERNSLVQSRKRNVFVKPSAFMSSSKESIGKQRAL